MFYLITPERLEKEIDDLQRRINELIKKLDNYTLTRKPNGKA